MILTSFLRSLSVAASVAILIACAPAQLLAQPAPTLTAEGLGKGTVALDGLWQFHPGDDSAWSSPAIDDSTGQHGWEQIDAGSTWGAQGHPAYAGYAWYRRHIRFSSVPMADPNMVILIPHIDDVYEIYWNGKSLARNGKFPPEPVYFKNQGAQTFALGPVHEGVLAFRVWKAPLQALDMDDLGGFSSPPSAGSAMAIAALKAQFDYVWLRSNQFSFALQLLYFLVAILCLAGWLRNRSQRVLLWMAFLSFSSAGNDLIPSGVFSTSIMILGAWLQPILSLSDIGLWFLLLYLFKLNENAALLRLTRNLSILTFILQSLLGWLFLLDWSNPRYTLGYQITEFVLTVLVQLLELYAIVLLWYAIKARRNLDFTHWLVAITAFFTFMSFFIGLGAQTGYRFTHFTLALRMIKPIFFLNGSGFDFLTIVHLLFFVVTVYAVFRYYRQTTRRQSILEQEFQNARAVQHILVPDETPATPGFEIQSIYKPFSEVGGDFFQILPQQDRSILVAIGDVSGKGMPAAMTVSLLVGTLRTLAHYTQSPGEILTAMNQRMQGRANGGFTTCLVLRADPDGKLTVANAGHIAPYLNGVELPLENGLPLGLSAESTYTEAAFELPAQLQLTLLTDGVIEARGKSGELFGFDRTAALAMRAAEEIARSAQQFGQDDDITVLTLTRFMTASSSL